MSPSDIPWWMWLLCAAVIGSIAAALFVKGVLDNDDDKRDEASIEFIAGACFTLGALGTGIIGLVRFVKWIWVS